MGASDPRVHSRFLKAGLTMLDPQSGIKLLTDAVADISRHCTPVVAQVAWSKLFSPSDRLPPMFCELVEPNKRVQSASPVLVEEKRGHAAEDTLARISFIVEAMLGSAVAPDQVDSTCLALHKAHRLGIFMQFLYQCSI